MGNGYTRFFPKPNWRVSDVHTIKGALDKYNIYVSFSNSNLFTHIEFKSYIWKSHTYLQIQLYNTFFIQKLISAFEASQVHI